MKSKLFAVGLVLALFAGLGVAIAQSSGWNFGRFQSFMKGIGAGTKSQAGMVNAQAQGSRDQFSGYNTSASKTFHVAHTGALTALTVASTGNATVGGNLTVTGEVTGGTLNCTTASYTNLDASGSLAVGTTSTLTGAVTASNNLTVAGVTTANGALFPKQVTADACTDAGFGPGAIFWNATDGYMCYCDSNTDGLKMNDNTTACF